MLCNINTKLQYVHALEAFIMLYGAALVEDSKLNTGKLFADDFVSYLIYLAYEYGISNKHIYYIEELTSVSLSEDDYVALIDRKGIFTGEYKDILPQSYIIAYKAQMKYKEFPPNNSFRFKYLAQDLLSLYSQAGIEMLSLDKSPSSKALQEEVKEKASLYIEMMDKGVKALALKDY